jgi:hypothetical protein
VRRRGGSDDDRRRTRRARLGQPHLTRRGVSSHASSGTPVSPPMISICICAM